jgi:hypothetical protein
MDFRNLIFSFCSPYRACGSPGPGPLSSRGVLRDKAWRAGDTKYAENGEVCQVSIEKLHIQQDGVELGASTMPRKLVLEMIDELAPPSMRGQATVQLAGSDYISVTSGSADIEAANYQNLSAQIYTTTSAPGDIAVVLQWKRKACESPKTSKPLR